MKLDSALIIMEVFFMSSENTMPKTMRGIQTRNKLFKSAEYLFGKNGYHQSSITEITQYAGVSLGNFYTYFESKYQIYAKSLRKS